LYDYRGRGQLNEAYLKKSSQIYKVWTNCTLAKYGSSNLLLGILNISDISVIVIVVPSLQMFPPPHPFYSHVYCYVLCVPPVPLIRHVGIPSLK